MERTKKEITTSGGHVVVMRDYITGREMRQVQDVFLKKMEIKSATDISSFNGSVASEAQDVALGIILVSFDGKTEGVVDAVLNLPAHETQEVLDAVNAVTEPKKK